MPDTDDSKEKTNCRILRIRHDRLPNVNIRETYAQCNVYKYMNYGKKRLWNG